MASSDTCPKCNGKKIVVAKAGKNRTEFTCPKCNGTGKKPSSK